MVMEIRCEEDLGVKDCGCVARGETAGPIVEEIVQHLQDEHDLDLPDAEAILTDTVDETYVIEGPMDPGTRLVLERLQEKLGLQPKEGPTEPRPTIGKTTTA
jgi:predicted small metal-binding protein